MKPLSAGLFAVGYPTAVVVITRFVPVVRERRTAWFAAHTAGVAAIVTGWAIEGRTSAVLINGSWLVTSTVWYVRSGLASTSG